MISTNSRNTATLPKHHESITPPLVISRPDKMASGFQDRHCMFLAIPLLTHGTQEAFHDSARSYLEAHPPPRQWR
ncbi:hypothetical protein, partial [Nonomuraea antri]|uniref:hypothetical protein n=1 Tax=Nonomuraea antri TaxID=2730852 RepID=UPI001C2B8E2D